MPTMSKYDNYMNFYKCQSYVPNPCIDVPTLKLPSIGQFITNLIYNEDTDYCYWTSMINKTDNQTISVQIKLTNYTSDYSLYIWYSNSYSDPYSNVLGTFQLNSTL